MLQLGRKSPEARKPGSPEERRIADARIFRYVARLSPLLAFSLGAVLFLAAIAKATAPTDTLESLGFVFGAPVSPGLLIVLVCGEVLLGSLLLAGVRLDMTLPAASVLFASFVLWIGYLALAEAPVGCGCGFRVPFLSVVAGQEHRGLSAAWSGGLFVIAIIGSAGVASRRQSRMFTKSDAKEA